MAEHELKTWPDMFAELTRGKNFELRKDDRGFAVGDTLRLREYSPGPDEYTGRELIATVSYKLDGTNVFGAAGLQEGYCILGLALEGPAKPLGSP